MDNKRKFVAGLMVVAAIFAGSGSAMGEAIERVVPQKARPLPLSAVRLTGGPLKAAQDRNAQYLLSLEPDRMLHHLRRRAGLEPRAPEGYGGWDGGGRQLTGHIAGHYLSAVSYMFAATGDDRFKQRADYIVDELKLIQDAHGDGYIGGLLDAQGVDAKVLFKQVAEGNIRSQGFDLNGLWSPWYVQHKLYAGLRDAYRLTGNTTALDVEIKFAQWAESIVGGLTDEQTQRMLATEFGAMNEVLVDLYADTADKRWLELSEKFRHRAVVDPLARGEDNLPGKHGNTQVPKLLGELVRHVYSGEPTSGQAARFFWDRVAHHHSFATGGHGRNEYFGQPDFLSAMIDGRTAESCNVYNMLKYTRQLFALEPKIEYAEFMERALLNHVLASIDPKTGQTCYMVPVGRGVQHEYQDMYGSFTCCVGTGMESHALHADGIYYEAGNELWINLYAPTTARWESAGATITVETDLPEGEAVMIRPAPDAPRELTLHIRRPSWAGEGFAVLVNGRAVAELPPPGSYVRLSRAWSAGDEIRLDLPRTLRLEPLPDNPSRAAILWGPLVLAGDLGERIRDRRGGASADPVPIFITDAPVDQWLKPIEGNATRFRTSNVGLDRDVEFAPFYQVHQRRYAVYWDIFTSAQWAQRQAEYAAEQERLRALEAATVAFAQPGEMQPERDFNFQGENPELARTLDRPGRRSRTWISFDLPVDPSHVMKLVVTYSNEVGGTRQFDLLADGIKIGSETIRRKGPQVETIFFDREYAIPAELLAGKQKLTIRFQAHERSELAAVYGVRMIRADK